MQCLSVISCLLLVASLEIQAATLKGIVRENELSGQPMANVAISAHGASPTASDSFGMFTLIFPNKQPGEEVEIVLNNQGYAVANDIQMKTLLPADPDRNILTVILCKEILRPAMAARFYRLKCDEAVNATYSRELKKLQESGKATGADLAALSEQRDRAKATGVQLAEEFSHVKPGEAPLIYQKALRLFLEGNVEQALGVLDEEKLRPSLDTDLHRSAEAEIKLEFAVHTYLLKAQCLTSLFRFEEAEKTLAELRDRVPANFCANYAYGIFCFRMNRQGKALGAFERCLGLANLRRWAPQEAMCLDNIGLIMRHQGRLPEAEKAHKRALEAFRKLAGEDPERYAPDLVLALCNLGCLLCEQSKVEDSLGAFEEALAICRTKGDKNSETWLDITAMALHNMGNTLREKGNLPEAIKTTEEAIRIRRDLSVRTPGKYEQGLALSLRFAGKLFTLESRTREGRRREGRIALEEALTILRCLAKKNPEAHMLQLAYVLCDLCFLERLDGRVKVAAGHYAEARAICARLDAQSPEADLSHLKEQLCLLGATFGPVVVRQPVLISWLVVIVILLSILEGGLLVFHGGRALLAGDRVKPKPAQAAGKLGAWGRICFTMWIKPRSGLTKSIQLVLGFGLLAMVLCFVLGWPSAWFGMLAFTAVGVPFFPLGWVPGVIPIALLLLTWVLGMSM